MTETKAKLSPGFKTTELWSTGTVAIILNETMQRTDDWRVLCVGCASLAVIAWAYMHSRTSQNNAAVAPDA